MARNEKIMVLYSQLQEGLSTHMQVGLIQMKEDVKVSL